MKRNRRENQCGALIADYAATFYVLLLFLVFPLLDYSVIGMRSFFLWFAANQAAMSACKARTYLQSVERTGQTATVYLSACEMANRRANQIKAILPGISWEHTENNPDVQIVRQPINPAAKGVQPAAVFSRGRGAPLSNSEAPDQTIYVYVCRVVIKGKVEPFITVPWFDIPGLSRPFDLTVSSQAQYENVAGLII